MQIDKGEHFVVERGFKLNTDTTSFGMMGFTSTPTKEERYDRSYDGLVFKVVEVCDKQGRNLISRV